jgi:hypothetical protein
MRLTRFALFFVTVLTLVSTPAFALNYHRVFQDMKLPTQQMIEKQTIENPAAAGTTDVLSGHAGATSAAAATVTSFVAQPDVPRNLVITPGGTTTDVEECNVVVTGTNFFGQSITETFAFAANASSATTGSKAFKTVTSIAFPANCESGGFAATWSVGYGEKLGLKRCMDSAGHSVMSTVGGAYESTRATMAADADEIEKNTADFNGTMNGSNDFEIFFFQNFRCLP